MFAFQSILVGCTLVSARTSWDQLESSNYDFDAYLKEFGKQYDTPAEHASRKKIFDARLSSVLQHNRDVNSSYKRGVNKFSDLSKEEFQSYLGYKPTPLSGASSPPKKTMAIQDLPASIDWRTKGVVTPVKNQGGCGSCWAFAATETIESAVAIATGKLEVLSEQNMVSCTNNTQHCGGTGGCQGATAELGFDYVKQMGISSEANYPYRGVTGICKETTKSATITGYVKNPQNDHDALLTAIATVGPQAITVSADSWMDVENGIFDGCAKDSTLDHGVQLVGYGTDAGTDYWLVRNSWGESWGDAGYIKLKRFGNSTDYCGTDSNPADGTGCTDGPKTVPICGMCGILYDTCYPTAV